MYKIHVHKYIRDRWKPRNSKLNFEIFPHLAHTTTFGQTLAMKNGCTQHNAFEFWAEN